MRSRTRSRKAATAALSAADVRRQGSGRHSILDPIITMNAGGLIQSASDSVEQVFGWTPAELFGRNVKILIPEPRRSALDRYLDRYRHADRTKTLQRTRRFDAMRKDGTSLQIELSMSRADLPVHDAPYFIGIIRDVSHQIEVGADSADERSRLHLLITEQTRALANANLRLQLADRLASLGTLAAGLGHDMNNVLLPVRARLNALEHTGITPAARNHVKAVRRSIAYLQHLSDGLHFLAIDPDGSGTAQDGDGVTDLAHWWKQVGSLLRKAVPKHVKFETSFPARLPLIRIAPHWLTQAVLNLIVNAGEALQEKRRPARVRLSAIADDDGLTVRLSVADNGRGMAPEIRRRAFDLFFTTKARGMGTGLGLPLVRKVAVRAGGSVELTSGPGRGTTVVLTLPTVSRHVSDAASPQLSKRSAAVSVGDHRAAVLISQILIAAGVQIAATRGHGPGQSLLWVTEPTLKSLKQAMRWRRGHDERAIVLLGTPSKSLRKRWTAINATVIDPPDDFETMRHVLVQVTGGGWPNAPSKEDL